MPVSETRTLYAPWIESLGGKYGTAMAGQAATQMTPQQLQGMAPTVEKQTALQQAATRLTGEGIADPTTGLASYAPYMSAAGTQLGAAGTGIEGAETGLAGLAGAYAAPATAGIQQAQGTLGGVGQYIGAAGTGLGQAGGALAGAQTQMGGAQQYISQAAGLTGPMTGQQQTDYMSPYQSQVIDTTLQEFDKQAKMRQQAISDAAVGLGGFGGGREGVMQSEYQLGSDKNRAALEAQLLNQGFSQAQAARQADLSSRLGIGGAQQQYASGLAGLAGQQAGFAGQAGQFAGARAGLAGQQAGFAQQQLGLGGAQQALAGAQLGAGQAYLQPGQFASGVLGQQAGAAGQRAQLAQSQLGIAGAQQGMQGQDIARAGSVGAADQAYAQAREDAKREANRMAAYEPYERIGWLGQGVMGMMGGMAPQYSFSQQSNPSPLSQALGIAATGAGAYKAFQGN